MKQLKSLEVKTLSFLLCALPGFAFSMLYGKDDRIEVKNAPDAVRELAKSVGILIEKDNLKLSKDKLSYLVAPLNFKHCSDSPYYGQKSIGPFQCTVSKSGANRMVGAAHCMSNQHSCDYSAIIFDYYDDQMVTIDGKQYLKFPKENVYFCKDIVDVKSAKPSKVTFYDSWTKKEGVKSDRVEFKVDRVIQKRSALKFSRRESSYLSSRVYALGFPDGLPMKMSQNGSVVEQQDPSYFTAQLDIFSGNSGGPVFDAETHEVIGLVGSGPNPNYLDKIDRDGQECLAPNTFNPELYRDIKGEEITTFFYEFAFVNQANLIKAVANGDTTTAYSLIIEQGVDSTIVDERGETLLMVAMRNDDASMVDLILTSGAVPQIDFKNKKGQDAPYLAVANNNSMAFQAFASHVSFTQYNYGQTYPNGKSLRDVANLLENKKILGLLGEKKR